MGDKNGRRGSFKFSKPRIGQTVKDAVKTSNRLSNLHSLTSKFDVVKIKLSQLIEALKIQYNAMGELNQSRLRVAEKVSLLAMNSPLSKTAGDMSDQNGDNVTLSDLNSYLDIHKNLNIRCKMYEEKYLEHIIQCSVDWFNEIETKVTSSLKITNKLRKDYEHYEAKCNRLHFDKERVAKSGTESASFVNLVSKLNRNEEKLHIAKLEYESCLQMTSSLVEEVTSNCWKDLFPILLKLTQFDSSLASDEEKLLSNLKRAMKSMIKLQKSHKLNPERRVKELEECTRILAIPKEQSSSNSDENRNPEVCNKRSRHQELRNEENVSYLSSGVKITRIHSTLGKDGESPEIEVDMKSLGGNSTSAIKSESPDLKLEKFTDKSKDQNIVKHKIKKIRESSTNAYALY